MTGLLRAAGIPEAVLASGAGTLSVLNRDLPDLVVPSGPWEAGAALDGRIFRLDAQIRETGEKMPEGVFAFRDGGFQSSRCELYCTFGWQDYRTWRDGEITHFTATTRCPDAPHTVVWYGTVKCELMRLEGTLTTRRWYWTRQIRVVGEGVVTEES